MADMMAMGINTEEEMAGMLEAFIRDCDKEGIVRGLVQNGRADLALRAVERGLFDPNCQGNTPVRLIHMAAHEGALELLRCLVLTKGVDANLEATQGMRPLHLAVNPHGQGQGHGHGHGGCGCGHAHGHGHGHDHEEEEEDEEADEAAAAPAPAPPQHEEAALFLINEAPGVDVNAPTTREKATPLMIACQSGLLSVVKALVAKGVVVDAVDTDGESAVVYAARGAVKTGREGCMECVLFLLEEAGAAWDKGETCLQLLLAAAAGAGDRALIEKVVQRIRAAGVASEALAEALGGAAVAALQGKQVGALEALVAAGLDVTRQVPGRSRGEATMFDLLPVACQLGDLPTVEFLVGKGCDPLKLDEAKWLPIHYAVEHLPVLEHLVTKCGVPVDALTDGFVRHTALHEAVREGHEEAARWLVDHGADSRRSFFLPAGDDRFDPEDGDPRASTLAAMTGQLELATFLRGAEEAADAAELAAQAEARVQQALATAASEGSSVPVERPAPLAEFMVAEEPPHELMCPISLQLLDRPVRLPLDGKVYSHAHITQHVMGRVLRGQPVTSPVTNVVGDDRESYTTVHDKEMAERVAAYREARVQAWVAAEARWRAAQQAGAAGR